MNPSISVPVTDNNAVASVEATVNGARATATYAGGVLTVTGYVLHEGSNTVDAAATDTSGLRATKSWIFNVNVAGQDCVGCHGSSWETAPGMGPDCFVCHGESLFDIPHANIAASHAFPPDRAATCISSSCHDASSSVVFEGKRVDEIHSAATTTTAGGDTLTSCEVCHASGQPLTKDCLVCHPEKAQSHGYSAESHTADFGTGAMSGTWTMALRPTVSHAGQLLNAPYVYNSVCATCHDPLLDAEHAKSSALPANAGVCDDCHPTPQDTIVGTWNKTCATYGCHTVAGQEQHATVATSPKHSVAAALTTCTPAGVGCSATPGGPTYERTPCHTTDLIQEHNRKIGGFNPYPTQVIAKTISVTCDECHQSAEYLALNGVWDGTCDACHSANHSVVGSARYNEVHAIHQAPRYYDNGSGHTGINTMDAHGPIRTAPPSAPSPVPYGCANGVCHLYFDVEAGLSSYYPPDQCASCHGPNIVPIQPYEGSYSWRSGAYTDGYSYDTQLTLAVPDTLPAASLLQFKTYYDIETDWDYGYVMVSTNGGTSWTRLSSSLTTTSNPHFQNLGNGITGSSGGWVDASFDLSTYAGQSVLIQFDYRCDTYVYGDGWMLDLITVGPPGFPVFFDDVETLKPEWTVTGNRTMKWSR